MNEIFADLMRSGFSAAGHLQIGRSLLNARA
jgi:hypothetical protein